MSNHGNGGAAREATAIATRRVMAGEPVVYVFYNAEQVPPFDVFAGADDPRELTSDDLEAVCSHCLVEDHPEARRGIELAYGYGHAWCDDFGMWHTE